MDRTQIKSTKTLQPKIYAWYTPDIPKYKNWVKIGYTSHELLSNELVSKRVKLLLLKKNCGTMTLDL